MEKELHLICNAHLDPVWQWEWQEGAGAALSTIRAAAQFCREYDGLIFCHNEALLYEWIEEYEPELFLEIQELVKLGKWHIMGGWYLQPDCNLPSGEGFVRNILVGRQYFQKKFQKKPTTAINFDPFGHTRGLAQIMAKFGFDSYIFCRPGQKDCPLPSDFFQWVGYDGSVIIGVRSLKAYNSYKGQAVKKIDKYVTYLRENPSSVNFCLWGVGNHGGGPSRIDLNDIAEKVQEWEKDGVRVIHSTPEAFVNSLKKYLTPLPRYEGDLNLWSPGCYTSQIRVKQQYCYLENQFLKTEKMCAAACINSDFVYPQKELNEALLDLLKAQFHDVLPGSMIENAERSTLQLIHHGLEILDRIQAKAFFKLCMDQPQAGEGEFPILLYNPHPYPVENDFSCEFMLEDQNLKGTITVPTVYSDGNAIACQLEKETSNIPIDWRKKVAFHTCLEPMQVTRLVCKMNEVTEKACPDMPQSGDHYIFDHGGMQIKINRFTGLLDSCQINGMEYLSNGAMAIEVYEDDEDPWGMLVHGWRNKIDSFTLLSAESGSTFSSLQKEIPSVRVIEDGAVRTVVEAVFGYGSSKAWVQYRMSKQMHTVDIRIRIFNSETKKMYKLALPHASKQICTFSEVAYGEERLKPNGVENVNQRYIRVQDGENASRYINIYNKGCYAYSVEENKVLLTLMRSPAYTAHPVLDRQILPTDRHSSFIEQGERTFDFRFTFGAERNSNARVAQTYNQEPIVLSFFPRGVRESDSMQQMPLCLEGDEIVLSAFKKSEVDPDAWIVRLFNPSTNSASCRLCSQVLNIDAVFSWKPFEIKTFKITIGRIKECDLNEQELQGN